MGIDHSKLITDYPVAKCPDCGNDPDTVVEFFSHSSADICIQEDGTWAYTGNTEVNWDAQESYTYDRRPVFACGSCNTAFVVLDSGVRRVESTDLSMRVILEELPTEEE